MERRRHVAGFDGPSSPDSVKIALARIGPVDARPNGHPAPPPPGPLAAVDLSHPRAADVLERVRRRLATWGDARIALQRASDAAGTTLRLLGGPSVMGSELGMRGGAVAVVDRLPQDRPLWIVGDVRGDATALATALAFVDQADAQQDHAFVALLGDWTGGTTGDAACVAMVLDRFNAAPGRTILLRGDREWQLAMDPSGGMPRSPALDRMPCPLELDAAHGEIMRLLQAIAVQLPMAAILPEGVLLVHGSLPRPGRLSDVDALADLVGEHPALLDMAFGRMHPREAEVDAGEREGGVIVGHDQVRWSLERLAQLSGRPLQRVVRGQDAAPEGCRWFRAYGEGVALTVTTMADPLPEAAGGGRRRPCVARLKGGRIRVARIEIPEELAFLAEQVFPRRVPDSADEEPPPHVPTPAIEPMREPATTKGMALDEPAAAPTAAPMDPAESLRSDPAAAAVHFERGVRLLRSRAWAGARDAFADAGRVPALRREAWLNEAVANLWLGSTGHQDALSRLRQLRSEGPRDPSVLLNLGIAFLAGERNPIEGVRAARAAIDASPELAEAWWALGLAAAMRSDGAAAASAFAKAADLGCDLPPPGSLHGGIPSRELAAALDALRGMARHVPRPGAAAISLHEHGLARPGT